MLTLGQAGLQKLANPFFRHDRCGRKRRHASQGKAEAAIRALIRRELDRPSEGGAGGISLSPLSFMACRTSFTPHDHEIARTTVKRILHDHGIDPAPERSRRIPWQTFLQAHWEGLAACDLFTVEVLTLAGLRRYPVFFVIALQSRRVTIAGIHPQPYGAWMEQMARNLTDPVDGCLRRARYLIHDRDPLYTRVFGEILEGGGVQPIRLPPKSPQSQRLCRAVRPLNQRGVSQSCRPPRRGALAAPRARVRRTLSSRAKPPGTRQSAVATTTTAGEPGRRRSAAGASRRTAQFLPSGGHMSGRPIKRTLRGLRLRHDHGSNYLADDFQQEVAFFGIESSPSFVREPEGNGVAERFIRTLKENLLWVRSFDTIEELRLALLAFKRTVQRAVDAGEIPLSKSRSGAT